MRDREEILRWTSQISTDEMSKRNRRVQGSPCVMSPVNKRLNFEVDMKDDNDDVLEDLNQFDLELEPVGLGSEEELEQFDKFSPCRTRSGLVYESGVKKHKFRLASRGRAERSRTLSGQSGTGHLADCSENESETEDQPVTVSRFSQIREKPHFHDIPSSPIQSNILEDLRSPSKEMSDCKVIIRINILIFIIPTQTLFSSGRGIRGTCS